MPEPIEEILSRLSTLETQRETADKAIVGLDRKVDRLGEDLGNKIDKLSDKVSEKGRPQWGVFLAAAGVILSIVRLGSDSYIRDIDELKFEATTLTSKVTVHGEALAVSGEKHTLAANRLNRVEQRQDEDIAEINRELVSFRQYIVDHVGVDFLEEDFDKYVLPRLDRFEERIDEIVATRFKSEDGSRMRDHVEDLRERVGINERVINDVQTEQAERRQRVYSIQESEGF